MFPGNRLIATCQTQIDAVRGGITVHSAAEMKVVPAQNTNLDVRSDQRVGGGTHEDCAWRDEGALS